MPAHRPVRRLQLVPGRPRDLKPYSPVPIAQVNGSGASVSSVHTRFGTQRKNTALLCPQVRSAPAAGTRAAARPETLVPTAYRYRSSLWFRGACCMHAVALFTHHTQGTNHALACPQASPAPAAGTRMTVRPLTPQTQWATSPTAPAARCCALSLPTASTGPITAPRSCTTV